jgi:hypothetical protein
MKIKVVKPVVNLGLLLDGALMVFSGLYMQFNYHIGHHGPPDVHTPLPQTEFTVWSDIHKVTIILFSAIMAFHIIQHWKWVKTVFRSNPGSYYRIYSLDHQIEWRR